MLRCFTGVICCLAVATWALAEEKPKLQIPKGASIPVDTLPPEVAAILDTNKDGKVTDLEATAAAALFQNEANAAKKNERGKNILASLDKDKNGKLDAGEAQQGVAAARAMAPGAGPKVAEAFDKLDLDKNGAITPPEFKAWVASMGPLGKILEPKLGEFFNGIDLDTNGAITFSESQMLADKLNDQVLRGGQSAEPKADPKLTALAMQTVLRLDRNGDGLVSETEARKDKALKEAFLLIDKNADNKASSEEFFIFLQARAAEQKP